MGLGADPYAGVLLGAPSSPRGSQGRVAHSGCQEGARSWVARPPALGSV